MLHLMKYRFISITRDRTIMFWSFIFPIILCTLFYVSFGHVGTEIEQIDAALVVRDDGIQAKALQTTLEMIAEGAPDMLSVEEMTEDKALGLLEDGEIKGIFYADTEPELKVSDNGISESVLQQILQEYTDQATIITSMMQEMLQGILSEGQENQEKLQGILSEGQENQKELMDILSEGQGNQGELKKILSEAMTGSRSYVKEVFLGGEKVSNMVQYFFALIAMTCLYAGYLGMEIPEQLQANVSALGARRSAGAASKMKSILADGTVICLMSFVAVGVLLLYISQGLHISIGNQWGKLLLISFVGSLIGMAIGIMVGSISRIGIGAKVGILTGFSLGSSALSGLMVSGIKGLVEESCPIINRINPASVITDAFYSVSIYPDNSRFTRDMATLLIFTVLCMAVSFLQMRRTRYESL